VPGTVKASTLPAHNSPIDTLLIAIAVTRKWVDESAGRQVEWHVRLPRPLPHSRAEHERHLAGNRRAALPSTSTHTRRPTSPHSSIACLRSEFLCSRGKIP